MTRFRILSEADLPLEVVILLVAGMMMLAPGPCFSPWRLEPYRTMKTVCSDCCW